MGVTVYKYTFIKKEENDAIVDGTVELCCSQFDITGLEVNFLVLQTL